MVDNRTNRIQGDKIVRNFGFLTAGRLIGDGSVFILFAVLSRVFGQVGIGWYSFAMAFTGFLVVFADFGLRQLSIKELSRRTDEFEVTYGQIFSLRLVLSLAVSGILFMSLPFLPFSYESKQIISVIGVYQVIQRLVDGHIAVFIAREDAYLAGLLEASSKVAGSLAGIGAVMAGASLALALATLPTVWFGQLLIAHKLIAKKYGVPKPVGPISSLIKLAREAIPYGLSSFLFQLHSRVDIILLTFFLGAAAAGVYNVAYRVVFLLSVFPLLVSTSLFPQSSRLYVDSREEFSALYHKSLNTAILIGLPAAAGVWLIAPKGIDLIFGEAFAESVPVLRILMGLVFLAFLNRIMGTFLMSCDRQREWTVSQWIVACFNVVGNLLLIPAFGAKGAAVSTLASEIMLVVLFAIRLKPVLGWPRVISRLAISGVGVVSFCLPFTLIPRTSLAVVVPTSVFLYCGTLLAFKEIRNNEVRALFSLMKRES